MSNALQDVREERQKQVFAFSDFDKGNTQNDWVAYITAYAGRAGQKVHRNERENLKFREMMVKVGALALAAIEANDKGYC